MKAMFGSFRSTAVVLGALLGAAAATSGCTPTVSTHGQRLDQDALAQIKPGATTKEEVAHLLGSPSSVSTFGDKSWYYVTQTREQLTFYQTKVAAQDTVRVDFDDRGVVQRVSDRGLEMARAVEPAAEKTRTMGNELTLLQQFVGNIGRFNPDATAAAASAVRGPRMPPGQ